MRFKQKIYLVVCFLSIVFSATVHAQQTRTVTITDKNDTSKLIPSQIDEDNIIFEKTEVQASVDLVEWRRHLESKLVPVIERAAVAGIKAGQYTVNVRFLVEKDGSISDVRALNDPGFGLAYGAVHVVRTGPKWKAGEQNGRKVRSYHTQPITFVISNK